MGFQPDEYDTIEKRAAHFHPDDQKRNYEMINRIVKGDLIHFDLQSRLFCKDGSLLWLQHSGTLSCHPITNEKHLVGILRDITQEKSNIESLKYLADHDGMTSSFNRRSGLIKLQMDIEINETIAIIYIDIDDFKSINDNYGHSVGDQVLNSFCKITNDFLPEESYLIRMGGDEFLCVIVNQSIEDVKEIITAITRNPIMYGTQTEDKFFFSYGIVAFDPCKHNNVDEFIRDADEQMYLFKKLAKICV